MKTQNIKLQGVVIATHGNGFYRVHSDKIPDDIMCVLSGKMSKGFNKPEIGDNVKFEINATDLTKGRITEKW